MSAIRGLISIALIVFTLASCASDDTQDTYGTKTTESYSQIREIVTSLTTGAQTAADDRKEKKAAMPELAINGTPVTVEWEDNESVCALGELAAEGAVTVEMSMYGGFEQVGALGTSIVRNDVQTTTSAGDIVLYSGSNIVIFYGSNTWSYTRLGRITGMSDSKLTELLGNGDVTVTLSSAQ